MSFNISIQIETDNLEVAVMLERVLGPVANALVEAIKPEIEALRAEVTTATERLEQSRTDYEDVNNQRINAQNENARLIAENAALKGKQEADVRENLRLTGEITTLKTEIETLVRDGNEIAAKLRKERDDVTAELHNVKDELERTKARFATVATRIHDLTLLLGNQ